MGARLVMRRFGVGVPYPWYGFATRFKPSEEFVGADFFRTFAREGDASFERRANAGLMASFDALASKRFDASAVHPQIRAFYEQTSTFRMDMSIRWNPLIRPFGALYRWFYADRIKQTMIPLDNDEFAGLDSWIELIDKDHDGEADFRCWIRVTKDKGTPVYVGAYKVYSSHVDDHKASYVSVAFPIPKGSITTVLSPLNLEKDGLLLTTRDKCASEAGLYVVFPHGKSYSMMPALGLAEEFRLRPSGTDEDATIEVEHKCLWLGMHAFTMNYHITRLRPDDEER